MNVSTADKKRERADLARLAKPQAGVDDLKDKLNATGK
jgi:hypothetical protein